MLSPPKRKIAILGGGMGAMSAAWAITQMHDWSVRFDVTVYQRGWRLGGRAASGRNMAAHGRVEEHGLHLWSGSFTQAIGMMRDCYEELAALGLRAPEAALGTFDKAFKPLNHLFVPEAVQQPDDDTAQEPWRINAPTAGNGTLDAAPATYMARLESLLESLKPEAAGSETAQRRLRIVLDLGTAAVRGMTADGVAEQGFDHLDQWEGRQWLARHGASREALNSSIAAAAYGFAFGYPGSLSDGRGIGAGTLLHNLCRIAFGSSDALFYKMQASAGDAVFAPLYQVLQARGVQFRFFHAVTALGLSTDQSMIDTIHLVRQAEPITAYSPLITVRNLPSWPSTPLWDQLRDGSKLQIGGADFEDESRQPSGSPVTLKRGRDFDDAVLGISAGALAEITQELAEASPGWAAMLSGVATAAVRARQLWLTVPSAEYGWKQMVDRHNPNAQSGNAPLRTLTAGLGGDMSSWADVSDLLVRAEWGADDRPWSAAVFTGLLPGPTVRQTDAEALEDAAPWLNQDLSRIWPNMRARDGGFLYAALHDPDGRTGQDRLGWQFCWTGANGSARQVLSIPGSLDKRLAPDASGFGNLYLAGDWTRNGINAGSAESAAVSGFLAALAVGRA